MLRTEEDDLWIISTEVDKEKRSADYDQIGANRGIATAQFKLACRLQKGKAVPKNEKLAVEWYKKAADQGFAAAQARLGLCYEDGIGTDKDLQKAFEAYQKAADQENPLAQYSLGRLYEEGIVVKKNFETAFQCYSKAAAKGNSDAKNKLGQFFENGKGVQPNPAEAYKWYLAAANGGHVDAQCSVGVCYENGIGVEPDNKQAEEYFRKAVQQNYGHRDLALHLLRRDSEKNKAEALKLLQIAAEEGDKKAKFFLENKIFLDSKEHIRQIISESKEYSIPEVFPRIVDQIGPYCGSAALAAAGNFAQGKKLYASQHEQKYQPLPGDEPGVVVLDKLKETKYSSDGPQFNIHSFTAVANSIGVKGGEAVVMNPNIGEKEYRITICEALKNNYVLILPCDEECEMPVQANGNATHWAFAFGYWSDKNNDYKVIVNHHGVYCEWSIHDLYLSNKQLPEKNPRADGDLNQFKFSFFKIPVTTKPKMLVEGAAACKCVIL